MSHEDKTVIYCTTLNSCNLPQHIQTAALDLWRQGAPIDEFPGKRKPIPDTYFLDQANQIITNWTLEALSQIGLTQANPRIDVLSKGSINFQIFAPPESDEMIQKIPGLKVATNMTTSTFILPDKIISLK